LRPSEREQLETLFDLSREITSVLDLQELLPRIPELLYRLIRFDAFAIYLPDPKKQELFIAYATGYPAEAVARFRLPFGAGLVGAAMRDRRPVLVNDLAADRRYVAVTTGMQADLVVPLLYKHQAIGAINVLSRERDTFCEADVPIVAQFGTQVAVALENARLFELEYADARVFETLAEIGRDVASILEVDALLASVAQHARKVINYRTFGIMLVDAARGELEMKVALQYGERVALPRVKLGDGLVGYAALHKEPVLVNDVSTDPRYIKVVEDVRSELAIPLLVKDRCLGVFDLESPELGAFTKRDVEVLTVLAGQTAVAIENARLYQELRRNEERLERELRFARDIQAGLLPTTLHKRLRGVDVAARFSPARELGGDIHDLLSPEAHTLVVAVGDVSGKGVPAALYGTFVGELIRSRTFRRLYTSVRTTPAQVLASINTILLQRDLLGYYCTLVYASFDLKRRVLTMANSGLPYPLRASGDTCSPLVLPGIPLGTFPDVTYDELTIPIAPGDLFVFCSDGVFEAANEAGEFFGSERLCEVVHGMRTAPARAVVDAVFDAVAAFRGDAPQGDDETAVAVRVT
jgi:sigma-B regulation protein RsbU (phosphoserine phosphatase)